MYTLSGSAFFAPSFSLCCLVMNSSRTISPANHRLCCMSTVTVPPQWHLSTPPLSRPMSLLCLLKPSSALPGLLIGYCMPPLGPLAPQFWILFPFAPKVKVPDSSSTDYLNFLFNRQPIATIYSHREPSRGSCHGGWVYSAPCRQGAGDPHPPAPPDPGSGS